jgi:hypothetical protein
VTERHIRRGRLKSKVAAVTALAATVAALGVTGAGPAAAAIPTNATPQLVNTHFVLADFGTSKGWSSARHQRQLVDLNGDHRADIVGFGDAGVYIAFANNVGGFGAVKFVLAAYGYNQGWRLPSGTGSTPTDPTTPRYVTDITGDGIPDIVGVNQAGAWTSVGDGKGGFTAPKLQAGSITASDCFLGVYAGDVNGDRRTDLYCNADHKITIQQATSAGSYGAKYVATSEFQSGNPYFVIADLTGDGKSEILHRDVNGGNLGPLLTATPTADGTYAASVHTFVDPPPTRDWMANGASPPVDFTADGFADFWGVGENVVGLGTAISRGDGTFNYYRSGTTDFTGTESILAADLSHDNRADIIGFGNGGVWTAIATGSGGTFKSAQFAISDLSAQQGWTTPDHPRFIADITGEGYGDIVGFGDAGVYTAVGTGNGFFH